MRMMGALWSLLTVLGSTHSFASLQAAQQAGPAAFARPHRGGGSDGNVANVLPSFSGIWLADGDEALSLPTGCSLMVRVEAKSRQLIRTVICANGNLETETAPITGIGIEPSRFPGGFQFRSTIGDSQSSCGDGQTSAVAALSGLAFDLKTAAGGEAATFAYMQFGEVEVAMHSGGAIDLFNRNKDCDSILKEAQDLTDTPDNQLVKLAAKVCNVDAQPTGCFTADGYVANPVQ